MNLCYFELLGNADDVNSEPDKYVAVTKEEILQAAKTVLNESNCSTIYYKAKK
jgi:predicted Zn-dependent peptidase